MSEVHDLKNEIKDLNEQLDVYQKILEDPEIYIESFSEMYEDPDKFFEKIESQMIDYIKRNKNFKAKVVQETRPKNFEPYSSQTRSNPVRSEARYTQSGAIFSPRSTTSHIRGSSRVGYTSTSRPIRS